jgi:hypothetical protein
MADEFDSWRAMLAGEKVSLQEEMPLLGYYKIRDRRGDAEGLKREWVPCALWRDFRGNIVAEMDGDAVSISAIWPYAARTPITFEEYTEMHEARK